MRKCTAGGMPDGLTRVHRDGLFAVDGQLIYPEHLFERLAELPPPTGNVENAAPPEDICTNRGVE